MVLNNKKGFTLIELLVVIVIIAVLSAIGYQKYTGAVRDAKKTEPQVFLRDIYMKQLEYYQEFDKYVAGSGTAFLDSIGVTYSTVQYLSLSSVSSAVTGDNFTVTVTEAVDITGNGNTSDQWTINQAGVYTGP